jgi:hypothetical protein
LLRIASKKPILHIFPSPEPAQHPGRGAARPATHETGQHADRRGRRRPRKGRRRWCGRVGLGGRLRRPWPAGQRHRALGLPCQAGPDPPDIPPGTGEIRAGAFSSSSFSRLLPVHVLTTLKKMAFLCAAGVQRVHHARDEPAEGAESHPPHHPQGDRANGADHPQEVFFHSDAAQAVHLRGCHDPPIALPRRKVSHAHPFYI